MTRRVKQKLCSGFRIAVERVCNVHSCHELFAPFGADGIDALAKTLYYPADVQREVFVCRKAVAFTTMNAAQTWLCRDFSRVSDEYAATILIHEALHKAGLVKHQSGPSSGDVNIQVKRACGL